MRGADAMAATATESPSEAPAPRPEPVPERLDVFISYSRTDSEFVRGLHAALVERGKDVYVDWEDIDSWSDDWQADLFTAIERAETFVLVLSPDSAVSPNVAIELEHAIQQGKRIRPLHFRTLDRTTVETLADEVRRPQWTNFRAEAAFEDSVAGLVEALEVDASWVAQHTRLLLRANEWERRGGDAGLLLRGAPLREAEAWLAGAPGKEPPPTDVQGRFIHASRAAARTRQRRLFGAVIFALAVAVSLAIFAFVQRSQAIAQRELADERARIARSRELAAIARGRLAVEPELGLLLAVEAGRSAPTTEARQALRQALLAAPVERAVAPKAGSLEAVAFSPDGRLLLTADEQAARLWRDGEEVATMNPGGEVTDAVFDPSGRRIAVAFGSPTGGGAAIWDAKTGEVVARLRADTWIDAVNWSGGGKRLIGAATDVSRVWDVGSRRTIALLPRAGITTDADLDPAGRLAVTSHMDGPAVVWDVDRERAVARLRTDGGWNVDVSADGRYAVTADDDAARVWKLARGGRLVRRLRNASAIGIVDAVFDARADRVVASGRNGSVMLWDLSSRRRPAVFGGHAEEARAVAVSTDGRTVASASIDGTAHVWELSRGAPARRVGNEGDRFLTFSWDGRFAVTTGPGGLAMLWPLAADRMPGRLTAGVTGAVFDGDSRLVALWTANGVEIWDVERREKLSTLRLRPGMEVHVISLSADRRFVATAGRDGPAAIWDAATGELVRRIGVTGSAWDVAYSPDGRYLAVVGLEEARIVGGHSLVHVADVRGASGAEPYYFAKFSGTSRLLVVGRTDGTLHTWSTDGWTERTTIPVHDVGAHAFSPDEEIAVVLDRGKPTMWDLVSGENLALFDEGAGRVVDVVFTPDGDAVLAARRDGSIVRYACVVCGSFRELLERAERRATRSLTADERRTYLHENG